MELFYHDQIDNQTKVFKLEGKEHIHIKKVLRKKEKQIVKFTNGNSYCFSARIISVLEKESNFEIISKTKFKTPPFLHLGMSLLKSQTRFEIFLEKAVEIGVSEITPLICERSQKKNMNLKRSVNILISALKQSNKYFLPKLNEPQNFKNFIKKNKEENKLIATCEDYQKKDIIKSYNSKKNNLIMIGPEGDFSKSELEKAKLAGFKFVSLGETRLRAETAGIMACAIFSMIK
tara:strand:- start:930 stop:1628 length:699 start_codon:yes stop_codon:yes gene_type:complete